MNRRIMQRSTIHERGGGGMAIAETNDRGRTGELTDEGIERFREKVGVDWPYTRWTTWNEEATRDGIRHYAYGFGDDNPLYVDPAYASADTLGWGDRPSWVPRGRRADAAAPGRARAQGARAGRAHGRPHVLGRRPHPLLQRRPRGRPHLGASLLRRHHGEGVELRRALGALGASARVLEPARRADRHLGRRLRAHRAAHRGEAGHAQGRTRAARVHGRGAAGRRRPLRRRDDPRRRAPVRRGRRRRRAAG